MTLTGMKMPLSEEQQNYALISDTTAVIMILISSCSKCTKKLILFQNPAYNVINSLNNLKYFNFNYNPMTSKHFLPSFRATIYLSNCLLITFLPSLAKNSFSLSASGSEFLTLTTTWNNKKL
jgi:hypothetical protein